MDRYDRLASTTKGVLRNIYRSLVGDESAASSQNEKDIDERIAEVLELGDPEILLDLRSLNGNVKSDMFDVFWNELSLYLEEINPAVDERRHTETLHMPIAISLRHLRDTIIQRLVEKYPTDDSKQQCPSLEWLHLQFWPPNPYATSALRYTSRFKVKFGVQARQLRKSHPDSRYVSVILCYLKYFCARHRQVVVYASVDDKAIIPVGEPGLPVSTGVRGHNRSIVPLEGPGPVALDHDFHVHGVVPSVSLIVNIPESASDSFFSGKVFVCLKDKVTQPSFALRHSTELASLVKANYCEAPEKTVMVVVSDGGPDHRITFVSVQVALIILFMSLDLDMLVCARTCPYQSWQNMAERVMSTLNLALMNVSLGRSALSEEYEKLLKSKSTMAEVRELISAKPVIRGQLLDSMQGVLCTLSERFSSMQLKGEQIQVVTPASEEEISASFDRIRFVDPNLTPENLNRVTLSRSDHLQTFMKNHCYSSQYLFQVRKCLNPSCLYCSQHPV